MRHEHLAARPIRDFCLHLSQPKNIKHLPVELVEECHMRELLFVYCFLVLGQKFLCHFAKSFNLYRRGQLVEHSVKYLFGCSIVLLCVQAHGSHEELKLLIFAAVCFTRQKVSA